MLIAGIIRGFNGVLCWFSPGTCTRDATKRRNGEWGMGNGEWRMENGEWEMVNEEWGMGNGEWGMVVSGNTKKIKLESAQ